MWSRREGLTAQGETDQLTSEATLKRIGDYMGVLSGLSGLYTVLAQVINELYGRTAVPLRHIK
jgi:succinate-acetate transporter protein